MAGMSDSMPKCVIDTLNQINMLRADIDSLQTRVNFLEMENRLLEEENRQIRQQLSEAKGVCAALQSDEEDIPSFLKRQAE
jgi:regulator of replication initiation timing